LELRGDIGEWKANRTDSGKIRKKKKERQNPQAVRENGNGRDFWGRGRIAQGKEGGRANADL